MSKTKTNRGVRATLGLSDEDISRLVDADTAVKEAKLKLDALKQELRVDDLSSGSYVAEGIGAVIKNTSIRGTVDYKKMLLEHPEIDVEQYTEYKEVSSLIIRNMRVKPSGLLSRIVK